MDRRTQIEKLEAAMEMMRDAYEILREVARETDDVGSERTVVAGLRVLIDGDHSYLSRGRTVEGWISRVEEEEAEEADESQAA